MEIEQRITLLNKLLESVTDEETKKALTYTIQLLERFDSTLEYRYNLGFEHGDEKGRIKMEIEKNEEIIKIVNYFITKK